MKIQLNNRIPKSKTKPARKINAEYLRYLFENADHDLDIAYLLEKTREEHKFIFKPKSKLKDQLIEFGILKFSDILTFNMYFSKNFFGLVTLEKMQILAGEDFNSIAYCDELYNIKNSVGKHITKLYYDFNKLNWTGRYFTKRALYTVSLI